MRENITCVDCGKTARGYHLVQFGDYDRPSDHEPEFRCQDCSRKKSEKLKKGGIKTE